MLGSMADRIILTPSERRQLQRMSGSRSVRAEDARRAIILSLASGSLHSLGYQPAGALQYQHGAAVAGPL
jgi:hypothetical protein